MRANLITALVGIGILMSLATIREFTEQELVPRYDHYSQELRKWL